MKSPYRLICVRSTAPPQVVVAGDTSDLELARWARAVVRDPQRHSATRRESAIVASLLADLVAGR